MKMCTNIFICTKLLIYYVKLIFFQCFLKITYGIYLLFYYYYLKLCVVIIKQKITHIIVLLTYDVVNNS